MAVREQIAAVLERTDLSPEQKRRLVHRIKCEAHERLLGDTAERTFTLPNGATVTINEPSVRWINDAPVLRFLLTVRRPNGNIVGQANAEQVIVNPPYLVPDGIESNPDYDATVLGSRSERMIYREDMRAAFRQIVRDVVVR